MWVGSNGRSSRADPVYETPLARPMSAYGSPCGVGSSEIRRASTTWPRDAFVVSISGVSAVTLTVSTDAPTSSGISSPSRSLTRTSTSRTYFLKPESSTATV